MATLLVFALMALGTAVDGGDGAFDPACGENCDVAESSLLQTRTHALRNLRAIREDEREVIVRFKNSDGQSAARGADARGHPFDLPEISSEIVVVNKTTLKALQENPNIDGVAPNEEMKLMVHQRGETLSGKDFRAEVEPWGIAAVRANLVTPGEHTVTVCVVDTGYAVGHPDLPKVQLHNVTGTNTESGSWNEDGHGHGTHCAGTIGAIGLNDVGVVGVNPDPTKFKFHIGKGLSNSGSGSTAGVMEAVTGCQNAGERVVISLSLGGGSPNPTVEKAYHDVYEGGALLVAAAGNGGSGSFLYPASYPYLMSVAATDSSGNRASFSQYNAQVEIAAPGVGVLSTISEGFGYASWSGTSMATPHVAGVAAKVWSHFPTCSNHQIRAVLLRTATDKGAAGCDVQFGHGIVDAKAAYDLLLADGCEAGGVNPNDVTAVSPGGCEQWNECLLHGNCPTPAPPGQCGSGGNGATFDVRITADNYPGETEWSVTDGQGHRVVPYSSVSAGNNNWTYCLPPGAYRFEITDTYGDGICCSYGEGSYSLLIDGVVIHSGDGTYQSSDVVEFEVSGSTATTTTTTTTTTTEVSGPTATTTTTTTTTTTEVSGPTTTTTSTTAAGVVVTPDSLRQALHALADDPNFINMVMQKLHDQA